MTLRSGDAPRFILLSRVAPHLALTFFALGCATAGSGTATITQLPDGLLGQVQINGATQAVIWSDGDTFTFADGPRRGSKARLMGVNTLETYGPVHRWGGWDPDDLLALALQSAGVAAAAVDGCQTTGALDKYDRLLVDCESARRELLRSGHGHLYPFDRVADPEEIAIQKEAQGDGRGMWRLGIPTEIVTKVNAATAENGWTAANWMVSTSDGQSRREGHRDEHQVCDEVCVGRAEASQSCLIWVPYELRYDNPPPCLLH